MTYKETLEKAKQNGIGAFELKIADMVDIYLTDIDEKLSDEKFESLCDIVDDKLKSMDGEIPYTLYDVVEEAFEENYSKMFSEADLVLDELELPYVIGDTVYDLIDDYTASDAYSEEDVARLRAMSPERLQEVFRCTEGIAFIKTKNQYALIWAEN